MSAGGFVLTRFIITLVMERVEWRIGMMDSAKMNEGTNELQFGSEDETKHMDYIYMVSDGNLIISLNAELDHHLADEMREVIDEVIDKRGVRKIIFDFSKIDFMDSAGIGLIMGRYKKVRDTGSISITGANESIRRILLISGLHKIVKIYDNLQSAVINGGRK